MTTTQLPIRIGADVGGTFTDVVLITAAGELYTQKTPSTPPHFEQAILHAIRQLLVDSGQTGANVGAVAHGTTVATNAVLEQRGARTALITTGGFRDVLELRRIRAPQMYDLFFVKPPPLVERALRFELSERLAANGEIIRPLVEDELWAIKARLEQEAVEAVAVCLLHAYAYPQHEIAVADFLRQQLPQLHVSRSSAILRERREYERTATTVVNAYVQPVMQSYLAALRRGLHSEAISAPLLIMQSAGGLMPEAEAAQRPVFVLESGPAAGVLATLEIANRLGLANVISFDMGGTTAKAAMIEAGKVAYSAEYEVGNTLSAGNRLVGGGGELIRAPSLDIAEVGAGGGSIAYLDRAGGLRVGPRSAGAAPGPACYSRGGSLPTVTDANVVLGYIRPGRLANGDVQIDVEAARRAIHDGIAAPLGIDLLAAAAGIHQIANAHMMRALRAVSTERGRDPREFALVAFGGSGPVHAAGLAHELLIGQTIIPPLPGLFSALGLLFAGIEHHDVRSCLLAGPALTVQALRQLQLEMVEAMLGQFASEGFPAPEVSLSSSADVRFRGQASEVRIAIPAPSPARYGGQSEPDDVVADEPTLIQQLCTGFAAEHERLYGHGSDPNNPVEVIAVRLVGRVRGGVAGHEAPLKLGQAPRLVERTPSRLAYFGVQTGLVATPILTRQELGQAVAGPLLIDEYDSTIVVPPGVLAQCDEQGNVILRRR